MTDSAELSLGLLAMYAAVADAVGSIYLCLQKPLPVLEGDDGKPPPELTTCDGCGRKVQLESLAYHKKRCTGPKGIRVSRYTKQREIV